MQSTEILTELVVSREAREPSYLQSIFNKDPDFLRYQYALTALKQSVCNNIYLRYRHYERVSVILSLTIGANRILDVGCGYGDLSLELANLGKDMILLDIDRKRLLMAKRRFRYFSLKEFGLVLCDAHQLPFQDNSFDVSFSNQVIEHVTNPAEIVLEKLRVSKLKAIIICGNISSLPAIGFVYFRLLKRSEPEAIPDLGGYDEKYFLNYQVPPINSKITILIGRIIGVLPILRRVCAGNVVKVYHKRRSC